MANLNLHFKQTRDGAWEATADGLFPGRLGRPAGTLAEAILAVLVGVLARPKGVLVPYEGPPLKILKVVHIR